MADSVDSITSSVNDAASVVNQIGSTLSSWKNYKQNRADMYYFYNDQRYLNLPSTQMRLRELAGLNPYGTFQMNSTGQPTPVSSSLPDSLNAAANVHSSIAARHIQKAAQKLTYEQILLEQQKVENQTKIAEQQAKLLSSQVSYQDMANALKFVLLPNEINMSDEELNQILLNNGILSKQFQSFNDLTDAQIKSLVASANASYASAASSRASAEYTKAQTERLNSLLPSEVKKLSADATAAEYANAQNIAIDNIVKNLGGTDSDSKSVKAIISLLVKIFTNR